MTRNRSDQYSNKRMEMRIVLEPEDYADLCALAKVSGLAASQYSRQVLKKHLAVIYAKASNKDSNP